MRSHFIAVSVAVLAALTAVAGAAQDLRPARDLIADGIPRMPNPPGPAPVRDLSGVWVGPQGDKYDTPPPMTPAGEALFKTRHPYGDASRDADLGMSNDPFITCDPLGFPRNLIAHAVSGRGRMIFANAPSRTLIAYEQQRVWREVWTDGRALPKAVDVRGMPESRLYGHSVGRWEGDYTFVIDTNGLDERPWLDEQGRPRSNQARFQERYTRKDEHNLDLVVTIDDPKFYTRPWTWMRGSFYWVLGQEFAETFCIPSEGIEYRDSIARPSGIQIK